MCPQPPNEHTIAFVAVQAVNDSAQGMEVTKLARMAGGVGPGRRNPVTDAEVTAGLSYGKVESCLLLNFWEF